MASPRAAGAAGAADGVKRERKRMRFTDEQHQLILDTHEAHQDKTWARQAELYNEEAARRGLPASMTMALLLTKCKRLLAEQEFVADRGAKYGPASRRRWLTVEDKALRDWNLKNRDHAEYEVFIKRMREVVDPSYFRSFSSVMFRLRSLGGCKADGDSVADAGASGSVSRQAKRQRVERCDSASQTDPVADTGDRRITETTLPPDVVPANTSLPTGVQEVVEYKLRCMEKVGGELTNLGCDYQLLRASDAALFGKEPPQASSSISTLHTKILEMIRDAVGAFVASSSPDNRDDESSAAPQSKMDIEEFLALQSKTVVSILDEKVKAAKEHACQLAEKHEQDRQAVGGEDQLQRGMRGYPGSDTHLVLPCAAQATNLHAANQLAIKLEPSGQARGRAEEISRRASRPNSVHRATRQVWDRDAGSTALCTKHQCIEADQSPCWSSALQAKPAPLEPVGRLSSRQAQHADAGAGSRHAKGHNSFCP